MRELRIINLARAIPVKRVTLTEPGARWQHTHIAETEDYTEDVTVELTVDIDKLFTLMQLAAAHNKSGRTSKAGGVVVCKVVRRQDTTPRVRVAHPVPAHLAGYTVEED